MTAEATIFTCIVLVHAFNGCVESVKPSANLHEDTIVSLISLGQVLKKVRARLVSEGYSISDGKVLKIEKYDN